MHDRETIAAIMAAKRRRRWERILGLRREAERRAAGEPLDHGYWALVHDLEHARVTTNLAQLAEIGVASPEPLCLDDAEISTQLEETIEGLAMLGVYLQHTDHLDDRSLYETLHRRILREAVRDVPTGVGVREWLDLAGGCDSEIWLRFHASDAARDEAMRRGVAVPPKTELRADRDRLLPRPSADGAIGG